MLALQEKLTIETATGNGTLLRIFTNGIEPEHIDIGYAFSRHAFEHDALHWPERQPSTAKDIPEAFYEELDCLEKLEDPFDCVFDPQKVRGDRLLHWLMRSLDPTLSKIQELANQGFVLIGDAIHPTPILGSEGADLAIQDALRLSQRINPDGFDDIGGFVKARHQLWTEAIR